MIQKSYDNSASLYLIPTPIGNFDDITLRALDTLKFVDVLLCEDTRTTMVLLKHFNIKKNKLLSCHEYNEFQLVDKVISMLNSGLNIGLVTDQGSPIISDPGFILTREIINSGFNVISLPGATAFVPVLSSSGLDSSTFLFYGFLNSKNNKQITELEKLKDLKFTLIFYESVHRIVDTLKNMLNVFGNRKVCIGREISKIFEEYIRGNINDVIFNVENMKGEFVIIVEGNNSDVDYSNLDIVEHVKLYLDELSEMDAIKKVAKERNVSKSVVYYEYHNRK